MNPVPFTELASEMHYGTPKADINIAKSLQRIGLRKTVENKNMKVNFFEFINKLIIILVTAASTSCFNQLRSNEDNALRMMKTVRSAQTQFKRAHGYYGSIDELNQSDLLNFKLQAAVYKGYSFRAKQSTSSYSFVAIPKKDSNGNWMGEICFFTDETGIIRASYDPNSEASEISDPIKNQE